MELRVTLMGALKAKAPDGNKLDVPDGATIEDVLRALDIPGTNVQIVMVNGRPEPDRNRTLAADDELTVLPLVGGG